MSDEFEMHPPGRVTEILDSIADGVFTVDGDWRITSFNRAAEKITGIPRDQAIGRHCHDVFHANICEADCTLRRTMETGHPIGNQAVYIVNADGARVPISISTALLRDGIGNVIGGVETFRDLTLVEQLRKELSGRYTFADIISKNHRMRELFEILPQVSASESTVLIEGESGTGKELFARAIHDLSPRKKGPFVPVNSGALPDTLLESELFGYRAGAFTDAKKDKPGRFELARGGTIFLDEIGDISPALQTRLLRVIQERVYEPLGGTESIDADIRIVTATNRELQRLVDERLFRQDLYYRINVIRLVLPPLRERKEDIPLLVDHFVRRFNRTGERTVSGLSPEAMRCLLDHDYPGNVRELENVIEHATVLCPGGEIVPQHLPGHLQVQGGLEASRSSNSPTASLKDTERQALLDALERNHWNRLATARSLGIHKSTLFRKIKAHRIELPQQDGRSPRDSE